MKTARIVSLLIALCSVAGAFSPATPTQYVTSDHNRFFVMLPGWEGTKDNPHGICYSVEDTGDFKELWRTSGWYSFPGRVCLTGFGEGLVRVVDLKDEDKPIAEKVCLEFYKNGKVIKSYRVKDVVDPEKVHSTYVYFKIFKWDNLSSSYLKCFFQSDMTFLMDEETTRSVRQKAAKDDQLIALRTTQGNLLIFAAKDGSVVIRSKEGQQVVAPNGP